MDVWQAAALGDLPAVRSLVATHRHLLDALDDAHRSPLHYAAAEGHVEIIDFLLASGAAVEGTQRTRGASTPLCVAVAHEQHAAAGALIRHGGALSARCGVRCVG